MRLHETWTGAANPGDKTYAVGSVEGIAFTVKKYVTTFQKLDESTF
jgi:hypothetical protein